MMQGELAFFPRADGRPSAIGGDRDGGHFVGGGCFENLLRAALA